MKYEPHFTPDGKLTEAGIKAIEQSSAQDTEESLCDEYDKYCKGHGLPLISADESLNRLLDGDREANAAHIEYLKAFIVRWNAWADRDYAEWTAKKKEA